MEFRRKILGAILLCICLKYGLCFAECPPLLPDPNIYIEDPNILENGMFVCGDPNNLTPYGTNYLFEPPIFWQRTPMPSIEDDCYAELLSSFDPPDDLDDPDDEPLTWEITAPYQGDRFVLLSTSHPAYDPYDTGDPIKSSMISQRIFLNEGDTLMGAYFFGTTDWLGWNDNAEIWLEPVYPDYDPNHPNEPNEPIFIDGCDVATVGDKESTIGLPSAINGWVPFSHVTEPNQVGSYYLRFRVSDVNDSQVTSYLAVDGVIICRGGIPLSDLNSDCKVNLLDFAILSETWLSFCPVPSIDDPNFPGEPNDYPEPADPNMIDSCLLADLDSSWFVDPNDLEIMSGQWLMDPPTE